MPLYEFVCDGCRKQFEALCRTSKAEGVACPKCGGAKLSRLISRFAMSQSMTPCGTPSAQAAPT